MQSAEPKVTSAAAQFDKLAWPEKRKKDACVRVCVCANHFNGFIHNLTRSFICSFFPLLFFLGGKLISAYEMSSLAQIGCLFHELNQQMCFRKKGKRKISINLVLKRFTLTLILAHTCVAPPQPHVQAWKVCRPFGGSFSRYLYVVAVVVVVGVSIVKARGHRNLH